MIEVSPAPCGAMITSADAHISIWVLKSCLSIDCSSVTVSNDGNGICYDAVITITAGAANITALTISTANGTDIDWTGTLTAGNALLIDCGAKSIKNNGVNAYSGFAYGGSHTANSWLELLPGDTAITIDRTGGSTDSTVRVLFREIWE